MLKNFWNDESGVIISAELILIITITVLSMIVGLVEVAAAINVELNDVARPFGSFNQSFTVTGFGREIFGHGRKIKAFTSGFSFTDTFDEGDHDTACDIIRSGSAPQIVSNCG